jgi:hypothetical protein
MALGFRYFLYLFNMPLTKIYRDLIGDNTLIDQEIAENAAIKGSKISIYYSGHTSGHTAMSGETVLGVDASLGSVNIDMPTAVGINGRQYYIKKIDSSNNEVTITPYENETIEGTTGISMTYQNTSISLVSDGLNWIII